MRRVPVLVVMIILAGCLASCASGGLPPFKRLENYPFDPSKTLPERVTEVPPLLLEALKRSDNRPDYRAYRPTPGELRQLAAALGELPDIQRQALHGRLVGIYFVQNLSSGGYSDYLLDRRGVLHTVLVLNPAILHTGMSRWITDKELSAFTTDRSDIGLSVECSDGGRSALLYILLHEAAHQLDYLAGCTPYVERALAAAGKPLAAVPFAAAAWRDYDHPLPEFDAPLRGRLRFYGSGATARLPAGEMPALYRYLATTPFTTLYASQNWAEDFAETAAFAALARRDGIVCTLRVRGPGTEQFLMPLLDRPPVAARLPLLSPSCAAAVP
ncbi:MAG TPA: hypothetical protein VF795_09010 [Desulfuromonadaceae bacterium]